MMEPKRLLGSDASAWEDELLRAGLAEEPSLDALQALQRSLGLEPSAGLPDAPHRPSSPVSGAASKLASKWLLLVGAGAAVLGLVPVAVWATRPSAASPSPAAVERPAASAPLSLSAPLPARRDPAASATSAPVVQPAERSLEQTPSSPAAHGRTDSLALELTRLERARGQLHAGNARAALLELAAYQQRFQHGALREEALSLEVDALARAGQRQAATRAAQRFLRAYPQSVHASRMRAQLEPEPDAP